MSPASPPRSVPPPLETSPFVSHDRAFGSVVGSAPSLARVAEVDAHEGPVYVPQEDALYFTTVPRRESDGARGLPRVSIRRLVLDRDRFPLEAERVTTVRADANVANGMTADLDGRLVVCEQGSHTLPARIARLDLRTGATETMVDSVEGRPLNSPNDVVVKSDGTVWFTDPSYGHLQGFRPEPQRPDGVYRYDPASGRLTAVADSLDKPNGLAFSPDERVLYVTDTGADQEQGSLYADRPHDIVAFEVTAGGDLRAGRRFAVVTPGFPDGIKVDSKGRVYASSFSGVQVFAPTGELIGEIDLPGAVNFTFGGPEGKLLFITTDDAVWVAHLNATGSSPPKGA